MKILVIAPHPDDEVLGCGGTIKKYSKGKNDVYLCIATQAYTPDWTEEFLKEREKEIKKANKVLGIKKTFFLDLPTVKLDTISQKKINDLILEVVLAVNPEIVFIPHAGDINKDHRIVFESSLVALRPNKNNKIKKILSYEILSETEWGSFIAGNNKSFFSPNVYSDITLTLKDKIKAMSCYKSEVKKYPHPRSFETIDVLARKRGSESGLKAAEAFMLIREIEK